MTINDVHSLIAPYALDALDADERAQFEAHLESCGECRSELAGFLATATRLGDVPSVNPPDALKERLMASVARTPQERPIVTALASRSSLRRALPRLAVAAATVAALAGFGAFGLEHERNNNLQASRNAFNQVLTAADAHTEESTLKSGGRVQLITSASTGRAVFVASDLPVIDGKTYQLWTIREGHARSEGLLGARSSVRFLKDTTGAETVAITVEPAGGSTSPTTPPIAAMRV